MNRVPDESHVACVWQNIDDKMSLSMLSAGKEFSKSSDEKNQPVVLCNPVLIDQVKEVVIIRVFVGVQVQ